jgi:hypothetical protein
MVMIEIFTSRNWHRTQDGDTVELVFDAAWSEWESGVGVPTIGEDVTVKTGWSLARWGNLRCSDIQCMAIDNERCYITVLYSTVNKPAPPIAADERSWTVEINTGVEVQETNLFYDAVSENWKQWTGEDGLWSTNKPTIEGEDTADVPPIYEHIPAISLQITAYSKTLNPDILLKVGKTTNSDTTFFDSLMDFPNINIKVTPTKTLGTDTGSWMFAACPVSMIAADLYEYTLTFEHKGFEYSGAELEMRKWNKQYDVDVNIYQPTNYIEMFNTLKGAAAGQAGGDRL